MIRAFNTHIIRKQEELTGKLWDFTPCQGEHAGKVYKVLTPCCWESHPEFSGYRGEAIYTTSFYANGNIRLELKGVSHTATVFLDGKEVATHYNAYTIFSIVIKNLEKGLHILTIKADNQFSKYSALHIPNDYMSYGGVSRPVVLEHLQDLYLRYLHVTPFYKEGIWYAKIEVELENIGRKKESVDVKAELAGQIFIWKDIELNIDEIRTVSMTKAFHDIDEWSQENPKLYYFTGYLIKEDRIIDDMIDRFGFRQVEINGKSILLNGKKVKIKGLCRHEDHPQFGCALPYAAIAADLEIIKHLNANSIRTAHYPNDELFLDLCDEQGILVWEENHARGLSEEDMRNPNFEAQAEQVIKEMIPAHYNHPSIYI